MKKGINFQFKDISNERISYSASYSTAGKLTLKKIVYDPTVTGLRIPRILKQSPIPNAWAVFYKNATFDSILRALSLYEERKKRNTREEPDDWLYHYKWIEVKKKNGSQGFAMSENNELFLKTIADNPDYLLYNSRALSRFVRILWSAKTGMTPPHINATREEIKKMLIDNLIPQHKGGRKYRPEGMELARTLLKKLADRISKKCMNFLQTQEFYIDKKYCFASGQWRDNYSKVIEWGKTHEYRIATLNPVHLKDLILKPADFADSLLEGSLSIGLRTINTPSSAK